MSIKTLRRTAIFWSLFIGIGAYFGAALMFISPAGEIGGMSGMLPDIQKLPLADIFFKDLLFPGIALLIVNGSTNTVASIMLFKRKRYGSMASMICGVILMLWICVQFYIFPFNFISTIYFVFGALQAINGYSLMSHEKKQRAQ